MNLIFKNRGVMLGLTLVLCIISLSCETKQPKDKQYNTSRIVSLRSGFSETLAYFGLTDNIVGVDVASNYPAPLRRLPKMGHHRNISMEGILALNPTLVLANPTYIKKELVDQFESAKIGLLLVEQKYTLEDTKSNITELAKHLKVNPSIAQRLNAHIDSCMTLVKILNPKPKVLFVYARGAGTLLVAGEDTSLEAMIKLAGGENALSGFKQFKPLTSESLLAADPDIILMFNNGSKSLNGIDGILEIPGMKETKAGKSKSFITMEAQYLSSFGPRVGNAALELNKSFIEWQSKNK